jgi:UDP-N-acetyl-D-galactosamine dehydrogenase
MSIVAVIGLGYVGLPLAVEFGKKVETIGYDMSESKVNNYKKFIDPTGEVSTANLKAATRLTVTTDPQEISKADFIIIAVPTPVDIAHKPDFWPLISSSRTAGKYMKKGVTVIYESTVYPGATEEVCVPELEKASGLKWMQDFNVGYSPERINPGDKERTLTTIVKVVAGDTPEILEKTAKLYESVITAGVHRASSIKVAEAAKVIENTQRDVNIALMNELALIFNKLDIDTLDVLTAAGTKWNFLPFRPGLVGGHCIGVDPYYLTHKAEMIGYHPEVILSGRKINDGMGAYIAQQAIKQMITRNFHIKGSKVIILGLTFKENCPDLRNSRVIDIINELKSFGVEIYVNDPIADHHEAVEEYGIALTDMKDLPKADAIIAAVAHKQYVDNGVDNLINLLNQEGCFIDVKSVYPKDAFARKNICLWRL